MLYHKNRKGSQKGFYTLIVGIIALCATLGCEHNYRKKQITMEAFSDMKTPVLIYDSKQIHQHLQTMAAAEHGHSMISRTLTHLYLKSTGPLLWVDRFGADHRTDSLVNRLNAAAKAGFNKKAFGLEEITSELKHLRTLDFDSASHNINLIYARLEYKLTKACLRYCYGQRYGFVDPHTLLNNLDVEKEDTIRKTTIYRRLYDEDIDRPDIHFAQTVIRKIKNDSVWPLLCEVEPHHANYEKLKSMLHDARSAQQRERILVNMERCRWRKHHPIDTTSKHIVVNIPAYHLYAYDGDSLLDMRVVCGAKKTKTPLLSSQIEWMEINPKWIIPKSIIEKEVSLKAGDSAYFARNHYRIIDKETQEELVAHEVTRQMLMSGKYRVAQDGGQGNSLGRIVFRFKNRFSVFLHDTSSPGAFMRDSRMLSHGCVRVARPFELAHFLLGDDADEWLLDRIRISMGLAPQTEQGIDYVRTHTEDNRKLVSYVPVKPHIPLYIMYYTLWPDVKGQWHEWPDIYGYDQVIWKQLQSYMQ